MAAWRPCLVAAFEQWTLGDAHRIPLGANLLHGESVYPHSPTPPRQEPQKDAGGGFVCTPPNPGFPFFLVVDPAPRTGPQQSRVRSEAKPIP